MPDDVALLNLPAEAPNEKLCHFILVGNYFGVSFSSLLVGGVSGLMEAVPLSVST
jgi:hypothetical protein